MYCSIRLTRYCCLKYIKLVLVVHTRNSGYHVWILDMFSAQCRCSKKCAIFDRTHRKLTHLFERPAASGDMAAFRCSPVKRHTLLYKHVVLLHILLQQKMYTASLDMECSATFLSAVVAVTPGNYAVGGIVFVALFIIFCLNGSTVFSCSSGTITNKLG